MNKIISDFNKRVGNSEKHHHAHYPPISADKLKEIFSKSYERPKEQKEREQNDG